MPCLEGFLEIFIVEFDLFRSGGEMLVRIQNDPCLTDGFGLRIAACV